MSITVARPVLWNLLPTECICGLAAAVTDLLQSVQLEYHGYEGDDKSSGDGKKGATDTQVTERLNELFSLVQGLGGTAVVRTYIDQLAQVLSALVGWSEIEKCWSNCKTVHNNDVNGNPHGGNECKYLKDVTPNGPCTECKCMKWNVTEADNDKNGHHLGRRCTRCSDSGDSDCQCKGSTPSSNCTAGKECKCALAGKCCRCCCTNCIGCKNECICTPEESITRYRSIYVDFSIECYMSAYSKNNDLKINGNTTTWKKLGTTTNRHKSAQTLLGSVCLIWSGVTYMHWTGKYHSSSTYWNNHILDGSGLDDGTLSQWLQALGFPKDMINDSGPKNRLDKVIWDGFMGRLFLGFTHPIGVNSGHSDGTTAKQPFWMNYAGFVHTAHRDSFNSDATVFPKDGTSSAGQISETDQHKIGAIFKLYILSCAYFTGLQKKTTHSTPRNPKTIREILYWLSALPYSPAYPNILKHSKGVLEKVAPEKDGTKTLSFLQTGRSAPITVHEFNLFAHFQAVTQYCPLVLIGIQGGIHSTKDTDRTMEPPIHALYANTACGFTYPTVSIQAYNQVVHYIRALFYQLYFLRKQCAVKVALGGKWRECRYGDGVVSKGVISWMCLGCDPMEHDRKCRVKKVNGDLKIVPQGTSGDVAEKVKELLIKIGEVVVQLGNAQERLDSGQIDLKGVKTALNKVFTGVNGGDPFRTVLQKVLGELETKVVALENMVQVDGQTSQAVSKAKNALETAKTAFHGGSTNDIDPCKNAVSAAIDGIHKVLEIFKKWFINTSQGLNGHKEALLKATEQLISICKFPKCSACDNHSSKCGKPSQPGICEKCLQPTTTGVPSPPPGIPRGSVTRV